MEINSAAALPPFSIAGYRVEPSLLRVVGAETDTRLEAKVMQVLVYLAEHAGQTVSRAELEQAVWPGRVVTEDTVTNAIVKLRRTFGDDARRPPGHRDHPQDRLSPDCRGRVTQRGPGGCRLVV